MKELAKLFGDHTGRYNPEIEPLHHQDLTEDTTA